MRVRAALLCAICLTFLAASSDIATADTITGVGWKGNVNDGNANEGVWSNGANWSGTAPNTSGTGDRNLFFGTAYNANSGTNFIAKNDLVNSGDPTIGWHGYRITFDNVSPAPSFTITGNAFGLFDFGGNQPGIFNNSTVTQTFSLSGTLSLDGTNGGQIAEADPVNGSLVFNNTVDLHGTTKLEVFGGSTNSVTFNNGLTSTGNGGNNSVQISTDADGRTPTLILAGTSSYNGATFVNAGTLQLGTTGGSPSNGTLGSTTIDLGDTSNGGTGPTAQFTIAGTANQTISNLIVTRSGSTGLKELSTVYTGSDTLSGGMTLNVALTINTGSSSTLIESGAIAEVSSSSITKIGSGTLTLSGANTYTGTTTISSGTLQLGNGGTTGTLSTSSTITDNGNLTFNRSNAVAQGTDFRFSAITGTGSLTQAGTSSLLLTAPNSYTGTTTVSAGTLIAGNNSGNGVAGAFGNASSAVILGDANTTTNNSSPSLLTGGAFTIGRAVTIANQATTGTYTLGGNTNNGSTFSGLVTTNQNFTISQVATTGSNSLGFNGGITSGNAGAKTITIAGPGAITINSVISDGGGGTLAMTENGGTTALGGTGTNTYSGGNTLNGGTLVLNNTNALGLGTLTINGGALDNTTGTFPTLANNPEIWNADFTFINTGALGLGTGTVSLGTASGTTRTVTVNGSSGGLFVGGVISNGTTANGLIKAGTGLLALTGANTYTGGTVVNAGTLQIGSGSATGSLSTTGAITDNGNLTFNRNNTVTQGTDFSGSAITGSGSITQTGGGTLILNAANTYSGGTTINFIGTLAINNGGTSSTNSAIGTGALTIGSSGRIDNTSGSAITLQTNNPVTWASGFTFGNSSSTQNLNFGTGAVTDGLSSISILVSPQTTINTTLTFGGTVTNTSGGAQTISVTQNGGGSTLSLGGYALSNNSTSDADVINGTGIVNITGAVTNGGTATASSLTYSGSGKLTLSGTNTYGGGTTLSSGTLNINSATALGTGNFTISGGKIDNTSGSTITLTNNNSQSWNGDFTFIGTNALNLGTGAVTMNATRSVTVSGSTLTVGGAIGGGAVGLTKAGIGNLTLSGTSANTYTGLTTVSAGQLDLNKTGAQAMGGNLTISGGTVKFLQSNQLATSALVSMSSGTLNLNGQSQTVVDMTNTGGLFETGAGTWTGTGASMTWGGGTNTVNTGGTIIDNHLTVTAGTNEIQAGGLVQLSMTGLTMNGGTLLLDASNSTAGTLSLMSDVTVADGTTTSAISNHLSGTNAGTINLNGATRTFTVGSSNASTSLTISASIIGTSGALTKAGPGTLTLSGANTYTGVTTVNAGSLFVNGSTASASAVTVNNSGTLLGGNGTIGGTVNVASSGANLSPGPSGTGSVGKLNTGALTLGSGSNLNIDITGAGGTGNAGSTYDQVNVTGTITLANLAANLVVAAAGLTQTNVGQNFFIVANDGTDAVSGAFAQNATVTSGSDVFNISYTADTISGLLIGGNDIALTLVAVPEPSTWVASALAVAVIAYQFLVTRRRKTTALR